MIELKVKTLDGRTQEYSVPDDASVLQFKEIILEKTDIPVERQRLLYQGKALVDECLLNSYGVSGNVMHLVTRLPPQARPVEEAVTDIDENSDNASDQFRNILSEVFGSLGDMNNPMGVSVNNEGNRMDITVNIPTQNRLSLSRLRQNYIMRLLHQARNVINHMEDPTSTTPRSDRERMRQADPYDIGPNDEMLTDVTSQPLPISNLADMIGMTRALWTSAEPQLEVWENVLRRENMPDLTPRTDLEMQRLHDSASRYLHLFSHVLHILSDYLVEFQASPVTRATAARTNSQAANNTTARPDGNGTVNDESNTIGATDPADIGDRSRYLYVFSEMPAQVVQVRLDVDSTVHDLRSSTTTQRTTEVTSNNIPSPRTPQSTQAIATATQTASNTVPDRPSPPTGTPPASSTPVTGTPSATPTSATSDRSRSRRRMEPTRTPTTNNLLRSTLHDAIMGSASRPQMQSGTRTLRAGPQFMDSIDPYLRCQSRHFQHPANLRSGAVIQTFSGIRLRESPRPRPRNPVTGGVSVPATSIANNSYNSETNVNTQSSDSDHMQSLLGGLMFFSGTPTEITRPATTTVTPTNIIPRVAPVRARSRIHRLLNSVDTGNRAPLDAPLSVIYPDLVPNQNTDNYITDQIIRIVIDQLSFMDLLSMARGDYNVLNKLREPLQAILINHQRHVGSRDSLIDNFISDMEFINRECYRVFEELRSGAPFATLSEEARNSFNKRLDILQSINNLNRHHVQSLVDMIFRSPTNQGFGQMLMGIVKSHHAETLGLIDIISNGNNELRQFLIKSSLDSIYSSIYPDRNGDVNSEREMITLDMIFSDVKNDLFTLPGRLNRLKDHIMRNFVVFRAEDVPNTVVCDDTSMDLIDDMMTNLSENITNGASVTEPEYRFPSLEQNEQCNGGPRWNITEEDSVQYSDSYVGSLPAKRRKVIVSQKSVDTADEMMHECIDEAIVSAGLVSDRVSMPATVAITEAFQELVTDRVAQRLETGDFVADRFPSAHCIFSDRSNNGGNEDDKKNN